MMKQNQKNCEKQIRNELLSEIVTLERNYSIIKDILSGAKYDISDMKGVLQSLRTAEQVE